MLTWLGATIIGPVFGKFSSPMDRRPPVPSLKNRFRTRRRTNAYHAEFFAVPDPAIEQDYIHPYTHGVPLRKPEAGAIVRLISPASPVEADKVVAARRLLEGKDYRVEVGENAFAREFYLAGTDEQRAADLQAAFDDPTVQVVLCTRGGYGCARLMPLLDLDRMAASGKLFIGFSDITTLHLALNRRGLPTAYAPMALTLAFEREPWVIDSFVSLFEGGSTIPSAAPAGKPLHGGTAEGVVTGGCLCLLTDSIGTKDELDCRGKIVLIEDVDENPHRVDAMLTHLLLSGKLQSATGIVVGEMTRTDEKVDEGIGGRPWREIVRERLAGLEMPIIIDFPFGHCKNMLSLPLGIRARIDADAGTLTYLENLCE